SGRRRRGGSCGSGGCGRYAWPPVSRASLLDLEESCEGLDCGLDRGELVGREGVEASRKPGGAAGADTAKSPLALVGQRQADAATVGFARRACDEAVALEPRDALRHRGGGDLVVRGE